MNTEFTQLCEFMRGKKSQENLFPFILLIAFIPIFAFHSAALSLWLFLLRSGSSFVTSLRVFCTVERAEWEYEVVWPGNTYTTWKFSIKMFFFFRWCAAFPATRFSVFAHVHCEWDSIRLESRWTVGRQQVLLLNHSIQFFPQYISISRLLSLTIVIWNGVDTKFSAECEREWPINFSKIRLKITMIHLITHCLAASTMNTESPWVAWRMVCAHFRACNQSTNSRQIRELPKKKWIE